MASRRRFSTKELRDRIAAHEQLVDDHRRLAKTHASVKGHTRLVKKHLRLIDVHREVVRKLASREQ